MREVGTLKKLDVKPGDVVLHLISVLEFTITSDMWCGAVTVSESIDTYKIISRSSDTPKLWINMTPEEKGALLLAEHDGKVIEVFNGFWVKRSVKVWSDVNAYRVRPEPKIETVVHGYKTNASGKFVTTSSLDHATHKITFNLINGIPDCTSIKMEPIA